MKTNEIGKKSSEQIKSARDLDEMSYWSDEFGISINELIITAAAGDTAAAAVEKFVQKKFADV